MGTHKITSLSRKNLFSVQNKSHPRYQSFEKVQKWSQIKRPGAVKKRTNSCSKISPKECRPNPAPYFTATLLSSPPFPFGYIGEFMQYPASTAIILALVTIASTWLVA